MRLLTGLFAAAGTSILLLSGAGCAHQRTVTRHDSSCISYGLRDRDRHETGRHRKKDRESSARQQKAHSSRPLKNPTPGLENPAGKPQDMNMDELRSILSGAPQKRTGGTPAAPQVPADPSPRTSTTSATHAVPQLRSVPPPSR